MCMPFAMCVRMRMYREAASMCARSVCERAEKKREGTEGGANGKKQSLKGGEQGVRDAREREKDSSEEEFGRGRARVRRGRLFSEGTEE